VPPRLLLVLAFAVIVPATGPLAATPPPAFDAHWRDGKAELDGYRLTIRRYGAERAGQAVAVYVTEPFSESKRVKLDDPSRAPADVVDVLKLNLVRRFQTGVYDYNTMSSLFVRTRDFSPVKLAFAGTEWCGLVHEELNWRGAGLDARTDSYFEGESAQHAAPVPAGGLAEEELFVRLRGLRGEFMAPGQKRTVPFLASTLQRRLTHRPLAWGRATIERARAGETVRVPAGVFACAVYVVRPDDGREGRFWVEQAHPNRLVKWQWTVAPGTRARLDGLDRGELTGSARLAYWQLNGPGGESHLRTLGLKPVP
jgi:hypothetical protein